MKKLLVFLNVLFLTVCVQAQTVTSTGTVTDSDGVVWANGSWSVQFRPNPQYPNLNQYFINGVSLQSLYPSLLQQQGVLSNTGTLSVVTVDNSVITPTGSQWTFRICPNAVTSCGQFSISTTSSSDISTSINANIPVPRFHPISGTYGYTDGEAILSLLPGSTYWNVTSGGQRCYTGTAWVACSGGGGGGTVTVSPPANSVQIADSTATNLTSDPYITEDPITHTLYVGGVIAGNSVNVFTVPPIPGSWNWDWTTPATALASLGSIPLTQILGPLGSTDYICLNGSGVPTITGCPAIQGITQLTGDGTAGPGSGSQVFTLATVNAGSGTCGDSTHVCQVTTTPKGLVTTQTPIAITSTGCGNTLNMGLISSDGTTGTRQFLQTPNPELTPPTVQVYQNTTGCPMTVVVSADGGGGGFNAVVYVGSSATFTSGNIFGRFSRVNAGSTNPNYYPGSITFKVPINYYYGISVTSGGASPVGANARDSWTESY